MSESTSLRRSEKNNKRFNLLKDSAILSLCDFERIKLSAMNNCPLSTDFSNHQNLTGENDVYERSKLHKQKLIDYDKNNKVKFDLRDFDKRLINQNEEITKKEEDSSDAIKAMNKLMMYAKTATIRDRQLEERKVMENMYRTKEKKLETMMELERLKELKFQEVKEKYTLEQQKKGALIVVDQIKENEMARLRKKELLERERLQMIKLAENMAEEDKLNLQKKKERNERMLKEAVEANRQSLINKELKRIQEREIDLQTMKFNRDKAKQEEELLKEKKRLQDEKEKELQILRSKQEKFNDKQAELDAIRSKRAYEQSEKAAREKERIEKEIREKKMQEVIRQNDLQIIAKDKINKEEKEKEISLFNKNIEKQKLEIEKEKELELIKKKKNLENQDYIINQIDKKIFANNLKKREIVEEGKLIKINNEKYKNRLEYVRQQKVKELEALKIQDKYIVDLKNLNLDKFDC